MPLSAWFMLIFGCTILYGGLALCISIAALKSQKPEDGERKAEGRGQKTED